MLRWVTRNMATTDLKLDEPGSLPRPGPLGRLVRLGFGLLCLWYVYGLIQIWGQFLTPDGSIRPFIWNGIIIGLFLVSYVINIGYSRAWKKWPAIVSALVFAAIAAFGYLTKGTVETHLGLAFLVAGIIATPGCEMRAFHDLYSRMTGYATKEHYCPVGPLHSIDQWEAGRH